MSFNLIPFGYHTDTDRLLDISEVQSGKDNGCVCPSCDTPLIARQGSKNDWHFAHASRKVYEETTQECEYSFYVSVRMMVRQLVGKQLVMSLPEYKSTLVSPLSCGNKKITIPFTVTPYSETTITDIEVEKVFDDVVFDFIGNVGSFKFMVFLSHEGRGLPDDFKDEAYSGFGILDISLKEVSTLLFKQTGEKSAYKVILLNFIKNNLTAKTWVNHPRYEKAKSEAVRKLNEFRQQFLVDGVIHDEEIDKFLMPQWLSKEQDIQEFSIPQRKLKKQDVLKEKHPSFQCEKCKTMWRNSQSGSKDKLTCPVCEN
jgi:hypothetical protein